LTITTGSACHASKKLRVFDSSRPGNYEDLGTPNQLCLNGGVGEGTGGEEGKTGENCEARKKVLIVEQAGDRTTPTPCSSTETATFTFDEGTDFEYLTLLNADASGWVTYELVDGTTGTLNYADVNKNGLQRIDIDKSNVKKIRVQMNPRMAVVDLKFCVPCDRDPTPPVPPVCRFECNTVDFNTKRDGQAIPAGSFVKTQWSDSYASGKGYGMTVSILPASDSVPWWAPEKDSTGTPYNRVGKYSGRLFDTKKPVSDKNKVNSGGDPDLGAPNHQCPGTTDPDRFYGQGGDEGDPHAGLGGKGENCKERGNVLIIEENTPTNAQKADPVAWGKWDDSAKGGYFFFEFDPPVRLENIGLMDIDHNENENIIEITFSDGGTQDYWYEALGGDTYQTVMTAADLVTRVKVQLPGSSGAVSDLRFCNEVCP